MREARALARAATRIMRGNVFWLVLVVFLAVLAFPVLAAMIPKTTSPLPAPIEGHYNYSPASILSSTYTVYYWIPNPMNVTQPQVLSVLFNATSLFGQTSSVDVHRLNATITSDDGRRLFSQVITEEKVLKQGQTWGPKQVAFTISNDTLRLAPGAQTGARVLISVSFDERAEIPLQGTQSYPKPPAAAPAQEIVVRSPYPAAQGASTFRFDLYQSLITAGLVSGLVYVLSGIWGVFMGLPRLVSYGSGFVSRETGRFMGRLAAFRAFASVGAALVLVLLANLGAAQNQINLMKVISDFFLGSRDLEALAAVALWIFGSIRLR